MPASPEALMNETATPWSPVIRDFRLLMSRLQTFQTMFWMRGDLRYLLD